MQVESNAQGLSATNDSTSVQSPSVSYSLVAMVFDESSRSKAFAHLSILLVQRTAICLYPKYFRL